MITPDDSYSTTRRLLEMPPPRLPTLPPAEKTRWEGGLRAQGCYKKNHPACPLISIITPVFNGADFLERSLRSVLHQPYDNVEYLVVDGGSTDGTLDILRANDVCIDYWVSEPDRGIYDAMNKGVSLATGEWLYFLGADDILVNCLHQVARQLASLRRVYYGDVYMPGKNKVYDGRFAWHKLVQKNICHQAIFYPRRLFEQQRFDLRYRVLADYELNLRCWHKFAFEYMPILVCIYNDNGKSNHTVDIEFQRAKPKLIETYFARELNRRRWYLRMRRWLRRIRKG